MDIQDINDSLASFLLDTTHFIFSQAYIKCTKETTLITSSELIFYLLSFLLSRVFFSITGNKTSSEKPNHSFVHVKEGDTWEWWK